MHILIPAHLQSVQCLAPVQHEALQSGLVLTTKQLPQVMYHIQTPHLMTGLQMPQLLPLPCWLHSFILWWGPATLHCAPGILITQPGIQSLDQGKDLAVERLLGAGR